MAIPLHISISEDLRRRIVVGDYRPGDKLPSEHQLMETFSVSRITARQAVANLVSQGLAIAHRGKGVFVTPQKKVAYSLSSPLVFLEQDMDRRGIAFSFENLALKSVEAPPNIRTLLHLSSPPMVYLQKKLFRMDGAAGAVDISYLVPDLGQRFAPLLKRQMTFPTLEQHGIPIEAIDAVIECTHADYEMSGHLEVPLGHPLIVYRYTAYAPQHQAILHGETISRADRFCYSLSITRQ
ncbi:GntR family transcriptional regulator [Leptolyngbya sp. PCC 6406]|uniref:GntR family transcriptional regulator n=1 Tax=Leptolyngbya sp. PCC 6406 TaxID=1173264 RepID=UPI0002ACD6F8|nr:GntR family transcriptional regulator [Leptolyngbya sp. PCC 6406]